MMKSSRGKKIQLKLEIGVTKGDNMTPRHVERTKTHFPRQLCIQQK
jgi:hypothetical protein